MEWQLRPDPACRQERTLYFPSSLDHYKALFLRKLTTKPLEKIRLILVIWNFSDDCAVHNSGKRG